MKGYWVKITYTYAYNLQTNYTATMPFNLYTNIAQDSRDDFIHNYDEKSVK